MFDVNSKIALEVRALADTHIEPTFLQISGAPLAVANAPTSVTTARFSDFVERFRKPLAGIDSREGLLIQSALTLALKTNAKYKVIVNYQTVVTDSDIALVEGNSLKDLSEISPPTAGKAVCKFEFDIVVVKLSNGEMSLVDVKRSNRDPSRTNEIIAAASVSARRDLVNHGLAHFRSKLVTVKWFPVSAAAPAGIVTRDTVNSAFGMEVREVVDYAIDYYRSQIDSRLRALIAQTGNAGSAVAAAQPAPEKIVPFPSVADRFREEADALERAFGRKAKKGAKQ